MRRIIALYLAGAREFLRDRMSLFFVLLLPVTFAVFFGLLFGGSGSTSFYLPGMLGVAFLWLGLFGTATPLVAQREAQVLRRLRVTPVTAAQLLAAQAGWRVTVGIMQTVLFLLVGYFGFGVGIAGNPLLFACAVLLGATVFVVLGYLLAGLASSSESATVLGQVANFPMMFLSGAFVPVEALPETFRPVAMGMPLTYLNDLLRQLMVAAPAMNPLWVDFAVLAGWLIALLILATRLWRWE